MARINAMMDKNIIILTKGNIIDDKRENSWTG